MGWLRSAHATTKETAKRDARLPLPHFRATPIKGQDPSPCLTGDEREVRIYSCGPTVYDAPHIGNLRAFVFADTLHRLLWVGGWRVRHTINITDFGHLTSDADEGEDKMLVALAREGLPRTMEHMRLIADRYAQAFFADLDALNIPRDRYQFPRASEHIPAMVAVVQTLLERGYAYQAPDGIYFDTTTIPHYGALGGAREAQRQEGARVSLSPHKRHPADFALWKMSDDPSLGWSAPWGQGFPGWHTECVAMIFETLGRTITFHTGGEDHITIHHNNELAQAEAITGKPLARCWLHNAFVLVEGRKMSKSLGNVLQRTHIEGRGYTPLALRYLYLQAHYRSPLNFTWDALEAAHRAYLRLRSLARSVISRVPSLPPLEEARTHSLGRALYEVVGDDLATPRGIAYLWEHLEHGTTISAMDRAHLLVVADALFGLRLTEQDAPVMITPEEEVPLTALPEKVRALVLQRRELRKKQRYAEADRIRDTLEAQGYRVQDLPDGGVRVWRQHNHASRCNEEVV